MSGLETMPQNVREALRTALWNISEIPGPGARKLEGAELDLRALTGQEWVRESTVFDNIEPSLIGGGAGLPQRFTQRGSYMVDFFFPLKKGTNRGDVMAGRALSAFRPGRTLTAGDIRVLIISGSFSRSRDDDGGWYFRPLMVAWECTVVE